MKAIQFRELSEEELEQKRTDLRDDLFKLKIRHSIAKLENPMKMRELRKDIARLQTILGEHRSRKGERGSRVRTEAEK
jgi:large subunit ribosomal protein L29